VGRFSTVNAIFFLKKAFAPFFLPMTVILLILCCGLFLLWITTKQKSGKLCVLIGIALLIICSYPPLPNTLIESLENQYPPFDAEQLSLNPDRMPKLVVVLGGKPASNPYLPATSQIGSASLGRLVEGIIIYRKIPGCKLLLSGGTVFDSVSDAEVMSRVAKSLGVEDQDLILESQSKDTKDQARFLHSIIGDKQFILVTSASHMPRTMALFKKYDMNPVPAPAMHLFHGNTFQSPDSFFPSGGNIRTMENGVHEYIGIFWARLRNQI